IIDNSLFGSQPTNTATQGIDFANVISGTGGIVVSGTGVGNCGGNAPGGGNLILNGLNTNTGPTTIIGSTLTINSIKNIGGGPSSLGAANAAENSTIGLGSQ